MPHHRLQDRGPEKPVEITHQKLLLVEGSAMVSFFIALLEEINLADEVQVWDFGGKNQLPSSLRTLTTFAPNFHIVNSLGIVRDAEENPADAAFASVCGALEKANLSVPRHLNEVSNGRPTVTVFVVPDCEKPGMIETLCLEALHSEPVMPCVKQFFDCVHNHRSPAANLDKAKFFAYISTTSKPDLLLGQAARFGVIPLDNPVFNSLKQFLQML